MVVGAGLAGLRTVETLRSNGFDGEITLVNAELELPYDRPPLSKRLLTGETDSAELTYRTADYFADLSIEVLSGRRASHLNARARTVEVGDRRLQFDAAVIATGAVPRVLPWSAELPGVYVLRTIRDALAVRAALERAPRVVVVGAGPIGSEVAASARARGLDVTIIEAAPIPFVRAVGPEMGAVCAELHEYHGVKLHLGVSIHSVEGHDRVERVRLDTGECVDADLVVLGVGVKPDVAWLAGSGLILRDGVVCGPTLQTHVPGIYAAGDLVRWHNPLFGKETRCEQWTNAAEQGCAVARNILAGPGQGNPFYGSNYFWSDQYGVRIQFVGDCSAADEVVVLDGSVDDRKFLAVYRRNDVAVAALAMNMPRLLMKSKLLIERRGSWAEALDLPNVSA